MTTNKMKKDTQKKKIFLIKESSKASLRTRTPRLTMSLAQVSTSTPVDKTVGRRHFCNSTSSKFKKKRNRTSMLLETQATTGSSCLILDSIVL